jgi:hypothetical protein
MEMPDCASDVMAVPFIGGLAEPALHRIYDLPANRPSTTYESAQCLYRVISIGSPEAMEQFNQSEIGIVEEGGVKYPVFIDGWGTPICWLRWAPGFSSWNGVTPPSSLNHGASDIQSGKADADPDPFDPRRLDFDAADPYSRGFHLIPLICSAGSDKTFGLNGFPPSPSISRSPIYDPYGTTNLAIGNPDGSGTHSDNITNHHIEQR